MKDKLVITSGFFNPIHAGHIEYLKKAAQLADYHVVILNNDQQAINKKGKVIIPIEDRLAIVKELKCVDAVLVSIDQDQTVCNSIREVYYQYEQFYSKFIFAKGGDRFLGEIPESKVCVELSITMVDRLGDKIQSSTALIENMQGKQTGPAGVS